MKGRLQRVLQRRRLVAGVAFCDAQLCVAVLSAARSGNYTLERYALSSLPPHEVNAGRGWEPRLVAQRLRQLVIEMGISGTAAVIGVKTGAVQSLRLEVAASLSGRALEAAVLAEAQGVLPYALQEVCLDFAALSEAPNAEVSVASGGLREVVIAACKRDTLDASIAAVTASGLRPIAAEPEGLALGRLLCVRRDTGALHSLSLVVLFEAGGTSLHLFLGAQHSGCYEWRGGVFVSETPAAKLAETIAQETARLALQFPEERRELDQALLVGGCAGWLELAQRLAPLLGCPVARGNPFAAMPIGAAVNPGSLAEDVAALAVACGLAQSTFGR